MSIVGKVIRGGLEATLSSGEKVPMSPDQKIIDVLRELKKVEWTAERGTWLWVGALFSGPPARVETVRFDADDEPKGVDKAAAIDGSKELEWFPRAAVPAWWQAKLTEAS